jgi:hypothetical protein
LQAKIIGKEYGRESHYGLEFEIADGRNQSLETKKGWMVKGGKKEPSTRSLYKLKGIKNADPPFRISGEGVDGWQRREGKPSIDLKKITCRAKSRQ